MDELARPFVQVWSWVTHNGGMPGQILFICATVIGILSIVVWTTNRRG
jgi:hypothetical protein